MPAGVQNASATGTPKTCFVIMGFGKKTDYGKETRTLDLDATYRAIINTSTDPETLGIAGAIQKRIWEQTRDMSALDKAVELYGRGFEIKRDYYNGENLALCLDLRAREQKDPDEAAYDRLTARKARVRIVEGLRVSLAAPSAPDRPDYKWMLATMANTLYAMGQTEDAKTFEQSFRTLSKPPAQWEIDTFDGGKKYALELAQVVPPS